ncbi:MAG: Holliday junction branch migration protein RuvA [Oscillospiraceae bacterium]|jgi:Holliday junction DNA helicase RuvA|nr:Holliday junction branch migration protein RuvA [Oscillospiraceae bacterium]
MFDYLKGNIADIELNRVVVETAGIGFSVYTTANTISTLKHNEAAKLFIREVIREDTFDLYGFSSVKERNCFDMLTSVSGIGPKAAVSILSVNTPEMLAMAVVNNDLSTLTAAQGIGKKIAQRVILELKDKISKEIGSDIAEIPVSSVPAGKNAVSDAVLALGVLGYSTAEIMPVIKANNVESMTTEQIIKLVLKNMG